MTDKEEDESRVEFLETEEESGLQEHEAQSIPHTIWDSLPPRLLQLGELIPRAVKERTKLYFGDSSDSLGRREDVMFTSFQRIRWLHSVQLYIILGYSTAFQVWRCCDDGELVEVLCRRRDGSKSITLLPAPKTKEDHSESEFTEFRPLLAQCSLDKNGSDPSSWVSILSAVKEDFCFSLRFPKEVYKVLGNERVVVVFLEDQLFVLDAFSLQKKWSVKCVCPEASCLGSRWLAYCVVRSSNEAETSGHRESGEDWQTRFGEVAVSAAKSAMEGIKFLAETGRTALLELLDPDTQRDREQSHPVREKEVSSEMLIVDVYTGQLFRHFSVSSVLSSFDSSGSLLAVASNSGHFVDVYDVVAKDRAEHLYRLRRGFSDSRICDVSFSLDSRWVAISSKTSSHIFPCHPSGVDYKMSHDSHEDPGSVPASRVRVRASHLQARRTGFMVPRKILKIGHSNEGVPAGHRPNPRVEFILPVQQEQMSILSVTGGGVLTVRNLTVEKELRVRENSSKKWDLCCRKEYSDYLGNIDDNSTGTSTICAMEYSTYDDGKVALAFGPQFRFRKFAGAIVDIVDAPSYGQNLVELSVDIPHSTRNPLPQGSDGIDDTILSEDIIIRKIEEDTEDNSVDRAIDRAIWS